MKTHFEDLEIRKLWNELFLKLAKIFYSTNFKNYSFQDQIMRASLSVTNNIAEWHERGSKKEFKMFLFYSKWSIGEVRSMLYQAKELWYIDENDFESFKNECIKLSAKIYLLIKYLKE